MKTTWMIKNRYSTPVWIRFIGEILTSTTGAMLAPFLIIYLHDKLNGDVLLPMIVVGLQPLSDIFVTILGGGIADRFGRKSIILVALFLQASAMAGFIFADSVWAFAAMYIINGIGRSLYIPAQRAQITDSTEEHKRSEVFAVINTLNALGMTIGPLLGYLVYSYNPAIVFALQSTSLFFYLILTWIKLPETAPIKVYNINGIDEKKRNSIKLLQFFIRHHYVLGLMVLTLPISFLYAQTETNYRIYIQEIFPNYLFILTTIASTKAIMTILLEIGLVKWTEHFSMKIIVLISYICYTIAAIGYGYSTSLEALIVTQLILTIGESVGLSHFLRFVSQLAPDNMRGRYFSMYGIHWDISRSIGPFLGGTVLLHYGGNILFCLSALLLVLGGIGQFFFVSYVQNRIRSCGVPEKDVTI